MDTTAKPPRKCRQRHTLPAVLMRAGTSKGLFIQRRHLPASSADWAPALVAALGSADADPRQVDGVRGATSTTSKVAVVGPSSVPGADVDYTFVQVGVGSCGNMAAGVGPFAVEEGLVTIPEGCGGRGRKATVDVCVFNTNTRRLYIETVEIDDGDDGEEGKREKDVEELGCGVPVREVGEYRIPGVGRPGAEIKIAFVRPAGSMTDRLFPTGNPVDVLRIPLPLPSMVVAVASTRDEQQQDIWPVRTTLIDAANPFVVIDAASLPPALRIALAFTSPSPTQGTGIGTGVPVLNDADLAPYLDTIEAIRRAGAVRMGLASFS